MAQGAKAVWRISARVTRSAWPSFQRAKISDLAQPLLTWAARMLEVSNIWETDYPQNAR